MKKETFDKYVKFLHLLKTNAPIYVMKDYQRTYHVGDSFVNFLIKSGVIKRLVGGSFEFSNSHLKAEHIVNDYRLSCESRNEPKQPKPEPAGFAYPISVRCEQTDDREQCIKLLESVGYIYKGIKDKNHRSVVTNYTGVAAHVSYFVHKNDYDFGRYNIDHFDADLIRDIASVRTGDVWVKGEPFILSGAKYYPHYKITVSDGKSLVKSHYRRPTIAEICDRYGYELNGMNIVKKSEPKPYATGGVITSKEEVFFSGKVDSELSKKADELQSVINAFNATKSLKQHEADIISLLKEIEADYGVSYSLTRTETIKTKLL